MSETMPVIDTDPEVLQRSTEASMHAAEETWTHIRAEVTAADGDYDKLMSTLRERGPYGYTIQPQINGDGTVNAPILTTWDEIRVAYEQVRGRSDLLTSESLIELRGTWYVFQESMSFGHVKGEPEPSSGSHLLGMFPVGKSAGITGELIWPWVPRELLGKGTAPRCPRPIRSSSVAPSLRSTSNTSRPWPEVTSTRWWRRCTRTCRVGCATMSRRVER